MFTHYIKIGLRNLRKNKQQVIISMTGLVIGIICFAICNYFVRITWDQDRGFANYKQINNVQWINGQGGSLGGSMEKVRSLEASNIPGVEQIGAFNRPVPKQFIFELSSGQEITSTEEVMQVNEGLTDLLPFQWIHKSPHLFRQPQGVILSQIFAQSMYGTENPIGKQIRLTENEEELPYTILGVTQDFPANNSLTELKKVSLFLCLDENTPDNHYCSLYSLTSPGADLERINKSIQENTFLHDIPKGRGGAVFYPVMHNAEASKKETDMIFSLFLVSMIGNLILIAGLINFFSIFVGSFYNRTRELSLREVLGAGSYGHFQQLFTEIGMVMALAFIFSLATSELLIPLLNSLFTKSNMVINKSQILLHQIQYLPLLFLLCILLSALATLRLKKLAIVQGMKGGSKPGKKHIFRNSMLGFQFFISLIFFGAAAAFQMQYRLNNNIVFSSLTKQEKARIFEVKLAYPQLRGQERVIKSRLTENPGIEDILESASQLTGQTSVSYYQPSAEEQILLMNLETGPNFLSFTNIGLIEGTIPANENAVLINETLAHHLADERSTGTILLDQNSYQLAGVINNFHNRTFDTNSNFAIRPVRQVNYLYVKAYPGYEQETANLIHQTIREWLPTNISFELYTLGGIIEEHQAGTKEVGNIFLSLAILCLLITSLGIYSSITTDTNQRKKEVAIRKVNGALLKNIIWLFGKLYIKLLLIASLFALPIVWMICRLLSQVYPEGFNYYNPIFWLSILTVVLTIISVTIGYRLLLIARINPAEIVKSE